MQECDKSSKWLIQHHFQKCRARIDRDARSRDAATDSDLAEWTPGRFQCSAWLHAWTLVTKIAQRPRSLDAHRGCNLRCLRAIFERAVLDACAGSSYVRWARLPNPFLPTTASTPHLVCRLRPLLILTPHISAGRDKRPAPSATGDPNRAAGAECANRSGIAHSMALTRRVIVNIRRCQITTYILVIIAPTWRCGTPDLSKSCHLVPKSATTRRDLLSEV
jgi:hypothetical protein